MKKKDDSELKLGYKVVKINPARFSFEEIEEDELHELLEDDENLVMELNVGLGISGEKSEVFFEINTTLTNNRNKVILVSHNGKTTFSIEGLDKTYVKSSDSYDLPDNLIIQLYGISYSHARALLSVELSKTVFKDKFFLPVTDPSEILKK